MLDFYKGTELSQNPDFFWNESVQEDLESFFQQLTIGKNERSNVVTYFMPKLTNEELKSVEMKDEDHLQEYVWHVVGRPVDVDPDEMKKSESNSKYVSAKCVRYTSLLKTYNNKKCNPSKKTEMTKQ